VTKPIFYEYRIIDAVEQIKRDQATQESAFHSFADVLGQRDREAREANRAMHLESLTQQSRQHDEEMDRLKSLAEATSEQSEAIRSSGEAIEDAVREAAHRIGYQLEQVNHTLGFIAIASSEMRRWLEQIGHSTTTLIELIKNPREVEALEVASQARASLAIGRVKEGLALAEEAQVICPTSIIVTGHLILALYAQEGLRDDNRIASLVEELAKLVEFRMNESSGQLGVLAKESLTVIPSIVDAASRVHGATMLAPVQSMLSRSVSYLIVRQVLRYRHIAELFDGPTVLRDYFWWQAYHTAIAGFLDIGGETAEIDRISLFLAALVESETPLRPELELLCARRIQENGHLEGLLETWLAKPEPAHALPISIWRRHLLQEVASELELPVSRAFVEFADRTEDEQWDDAMLVEEIRLRHTSALEAIVDHARESRAQIDVEEEGFVAWIRDRWPRVLEVVQQAAALDERSEELKTERESRSADLADVEKKMTRLTEKVDEKTWRPVKSKTGNAREEFLCGSGCWVPTTVTIAVPLLGITSCIARGSRFGALGPPFLTMAATAILLLICAIAVDKRTKATDLERMEKIEGLRKRVVEIYIEIKELETKAAGLRHEEGCRIRKRHAHFQRTVKFCEKDHDRWIGQGLDACFGRFSNVFVTEVNACRERAQVMKYHDESCNRCAGILNGIVESQWGSEGANLVRKPELKIGSRS